MMPADDQSPQRPIIVEIEGVGELEFPADTDPSVIQAKVRELTGGGEPAATSPSMLSRIVDALPTIGGMAGSFAGGSKMSPIGMALAGVGGAGGEAFRQVADALRGDFSEIPDTAMGRLRKIGVEGAKQAGYEGAGRAVGAVVQPAAKALYAVALRPTVARMRDAGGGKLATGLRRIINQGYGDAVMPSAAGVSRAGQLVKESAEEATQLAAKNQTPIQLERVLQKAVGDQSRRMARESTTAGVEANLPAVTSQVQRVAQAHPSGTVTPADLLEIRRGAEDVAGPVFKAATMPGGAGRVAPGTEASVARSIAGASKQTLDDMLGRAFQDINSRTAARAAVKGSIDDAAARPNVLMNLMSGGAGLAASQGDLSEAAQNALLLRILLSPTAQGAVALGAGRLPYAQLFRGAGGLMEQE